MHIIRRTILDAANGGCFLWNAIRLLRGVTVDLSRPGALG